jgi:hypothetical protein
MVSLRYLPSFGNPERQVSDTSQVAHTVREAASNAIDQSQRPSKIQYR